GLIVLALAQGSLLLWYATWLVMAIFAMGTAPITWTWGIATWFDKGRGLALALCLMGTGVFGFLVPPLVAFLISTVGWRGGYVALAALVLFVAYPVSWVFFHERREQPSVSGEQSRRPSLTGLNTKAALQGRHFWLIFVSTLLVA